MKRIYKPIKVDYKKKRPSKTIPDQSLSIQEIVKRYVRGVPVDVVQRQGVYLDQNEADLEKMTRLDFGEKHEIAATLAARARGMQDDLEQRQRESQEAEAKAKLDRQAARKAKAAETVVK